MLVLRRLIRNGVKGPKTKEKSLDMPVLLDRVKKTDGYNKEAGLRYFCRLRPSNSHPDHLPILTAVPASLGELLSTKSLCSQLLF